MTLKACDRIEDLRVDWERELEAIFASRPIDRRRTQLDPGASEPRLRLDASMAERIHRVARVAADRLGCTDPYALFLTPAESRLTAQAMLNERPFAIRLVGPVASALDDAALAMLIGHELGHWMALGPGANPPSVALEAWSRGATHYLACLCVVACELTADRFAMVAGGGDLEAAVRLDVAVATLDSPAALGLRELEYLERLKQRVERNEDEILSTATGYPTSAFRLYATWLFWRSDAHRELTGNGPGDLTLREVDAMLRAACVARIPWPTARDGLRDPSEKAPAKGEGGDVRSDVVLDVTASAIDGATSLADYLRDAATSALSSVERFLDDDHARREASERRGDEAVTDAATDAAVDDIERRFRALEAEAPATETPAQKAEAPPAIDDIEARFRALEALPRRSTA